MPSSITSDATITIENLLDAGPNYPDQNRPVVILAVVAWITHIMRLLLQFTTSTLGLFEDDFINVKGRLVELEGESSDEDEDAPTSSNRPPVIATTTKPSSSKAPGSKKCNRCGASGHDTTDCRTRNPEMVKKRIANNKKAKKEADRLRSYPPPYAAHRVPPSRHYFDLLDYAYEYPAPQPPSRQGVATRSMLAVHKDAEEFRRRQAQSARDRRKGKSRDTT